MKLKNTPLIFAALLSSAGALAGEPTIISDQAKEKLMSIELNNGLTAYDYVKFKANFNFNYEVVEWSCGLPCKESVIINLKTGELVGELSSCFGLKYELSGKTLAFVNIENDPTPSCKNENIFVLERDKIIEKM